MPADTSDIATLSRTDKATGHSITRLQYRGWSVDVDAHVVSVPHQIITTQRAADLQVCLSAALTLARNNARPAAPAPTATAEPRPTPAHILVTLLEAARSIAADRWHPTNFDIYVCTRTAWEDAACDVPYADLLHALRRTLDPGRTLSDYEDTARGRSDIVALYNAAIAALTLSSNTRGAA